MSSIELSSLGLSYSNSRYPSAYHSALSTLDLSYPGRSSLGLNHPISAPANPPKPEPLRGPKRSPEPKEFSPKLSRLCD